MRDTERERQTQAEGEAGPPRGTQCNNLQNSFAFLARGPLAAPCPPSGLTRTVFKASCKPFFYTFMYVFNHPLI